MTTPHKHRQTVSEAVRKLSEAAGVPEDLLASERASGAPFRPSGGVPPQPARDELFKYLDLFFDPNTPTEALMSDPDEMAQALNPNALEALLTEWWMGKAEEEVRRTVPKAVEYSSTDLRDIGRDLAECMGRTVTDQEAMELGISFYIRGKLSRWTGALISGRQVSEDTLFDLGVYVRMAQRVRDTGGWPGLPKN
jgi:hypothetical protein